MRICDICGKEGVSYNTSATIDEQGNTKKVELCYRCWHKLYDNENKHNYLAYKETVEEMTGKPPKKPSWWAKYKMTQESKR